MALSILSKLRGTLQSAFGINRATLDASALTAARSYTLPDQSGTVALLSDIAGGGISLAEARKTVSLRL